jgi:hypothetical protein
MALSVDLFFSLRSPWIDLSNWRMQSRELTRR